jgi:sulfite reductase beta subunit-like hemoprotein
VHVRAASGAAKPGGPAAAPTWEDVLRRNAIERLKQELHPLDIRGQLDRLISSGYEAIPEEDIVRLQWYGLYHDKPKVGTFMLRIKVPSGILTPHKLRTIGALSRRFGRDEAELTTRQNVQLHWITLPDLPEVFATLDAAGLSTAGGCGDTVRNITGCPVAGLDAEELFDARPFVEAAARFFYGNREYSNLPRKHKITISACPHQCNAPEINCIALVGARNDRGEDGFAVRVGGGLSTAPRISRDLGVWVRADVDEVLTVLRAIIDVWSSDLRYRMSRAKARLKFAVDDYGPELYRQRVEERLGRRLPDFRAPTPPPGPHYHLGVHPQKQPDRFYIGFPVFLGVVSGTQLQALADIAEAYGGGIRLTRQQNFILTDVPGARVDEVVRAVGELGFPLETNGLRGSAIACTGSPLCNYAVGETKTKLRDMVQHLEATFGDQVAGLRLNLDGCPHACAQHFIGDIGLQGTTVRAPDGTEKIEAYDIFLRGGQGAEANIGRPIIRRVPKHLVNGYVERLVRAYLTERQPGETYRQFFERKSDEELVAIASAS